MITSKKPLFAISTLMILTLSCTTFTRLFSGGPEPGTLPGTAPPQVAGGGEEQPDVEATPEVRRRIIAPSPTPFYVTSEDDVRLVLDLGQPDFRDSFDLETTWFDYDTDGTAAYLFEEGKLVGVDYEPEERYTWWSYSERPAGNTYAEVSATNGDCIGKDAVGLVIRVHQQKAAGGYALEVSCDGHWRYIRHRIGKQAEEVIGWTPSDLINIGEEATNRLAIWGYQRDLVFFINGTMVGEAQDKNYSYKRGLFALYVRAHQTYDLSATFDDFAFWHIPYLAQ